MGYVHDTGMALTVFPAQMIFTGGTWTDAVSGHVWTRDKAAAANTSVVRIPLALPRNSVPLKGAYLTGVDVWWTLSAADLNALSAEIYRSVLPANGQSMAAPASLAFSYDASHDTAAGRVTQDKHHMTLALQAPFWLSADDDVYVELSINAATTSVVKLFGARASYTLRV